MFVMSNYIFIYKKEFYSRSIFLVYFIKKK